MISNKDMWLHFDKNFLLKTDASITSIGKVLSQQQEDGQIHPVAFTSRAMSWQERKYINHFHAYLYVHDVKIRTDHSAVKAVLSTPGKHIHYWTKFYG